MPHGCVCQRIFVYVDGAPFFAFHAQESSGAKLLLNRRITQRGVVSMEISIDAALTFDAHCLCPGRVITWSGLVRAIALAEQVPAQRLATRIEQYLLSRHLVSDMWGVTGSSVLTYRMCQLTVDALPLFFPHGLQVITARPSYLFFRPSFCLAGVAADYVGMAFDGVLKIMLDGSLVYIRTPTIDTSELGRWERAARQHSDMRRFFNGESCIRITEQVWHKRVASFCNCWSQSNVIRSISAVENVAPKTITIRIKRLLHSRNKDCGICGTMLFGKTDFTFLQHIVDALPEIFIGGVHVRLSMHPLITLSWQRVSTLSRSRCSETSSSAIRLSFDREGICMAGATSCHIRSFRPEMQPV